MVELGYEMAMQQSSTNRFGTVQCSDRFFDTEIESIVTEVRDLGKSVVKVHCFSSLIHFIMLGDEIVFSS